MEITSSRKSSMKSTANFAARDGAAVAAKESNPAKERLERLEKERGSQEQQQALNAQWQSEKDIITKIQTIKEEIG